MANLKLDLVNKLNNEKYYEEHELIRLAQEPSMNYKEKIEDISVILENIALLNAQLGLVEQYFQEPAPQNAPAPEQKVAEQPQAQVPPQRGPGRGRLGYAPAPLGQDGADQSGGGVQGGDLSHLLLGGSPRQSPQDHGGDQGGTTGAQEHLRRYAPHPDRGPGGTGVYPGGFCTRREADGRADGGHIAARSN